MRTTRSGSRRPPDVVAPPVPDRGGGEVGETDLAADLAAVTAWGLLVEVHASGNRLLEADLQARHGIPLTWFEVLLRLARSHDRQQRLTTLANQVSFSSGGFTRLADRLVGAGLVERRSCDGDRRGILLALTEQGADLLAAALHSHAILLRDRMLSALSGPETEQWERLNRRLRDALDDLQVGDGTQDRAGPIRETGPG